MLKTRRLVLDVLKPHQPNAVEFARALAEQGAGYQVRLVVAEVDEKTDTLRIEVCGAALDFERLQLAIETLGGSLHSIDEVDVENGADGG